MKVSEMAETAEIEEKSSQSKRGGEAWRTSAEIESAEREAHGGYTLKELDRVAEEPEIWAQLHGKVRDLVTREPVAFKPRELQRRLFNQYRFCRDRDKPFRAVCCKTRRGGGSTGAEALLYVHAHNYNARLGAVGTTDTVSKNMFDFIDTFDKYDDFPGWEKNSKRLDGLGRLEWPNGSSWEKYTADNPETARSAGLQGYHATEVGRWQTGGAADAGETLKSMLGAVPKRGFTVVVEESTAQGAAGAFFNRWTGARWPTAEELGVNEGQEYWRKWEHETPQNLLDLGGDLQFVRVFAAWFEDDENKQPVTVTEIEYLQRTLDAKERELMRRYETLGPQGARLGEYVIEATLWEQLSWRRSVIESEFDGDVEGFEQEYPSSPHEAFASSGRHSFNAHGVAHMVSQAKSSHPECGVLTMQHGGEVVFTRTDDSEAWLYVWEHPKEGHRYVNGTDTMSGAEQSAGSKVHDYHASIVLRASYTDADGRRQPVRTAAAIMPRSTVEADVLAKQVDMLHRWYGRCLVVPEINNTGYGFMVAAKPLGMNVYRRERTDRFTSEVTEQWGWMTDPKTRPQLIATMQAAIRNNAQEATRGDGLQCDSVTLASECSTMVKDAKGVDKAAPGSHDDHVLACALALANLSGATYFSGHRRRRRGPPDRKAWKKYGGLR